MARDKSKTKRVALCGILSALALVLMLLAGVLPTSSYALTALSGIILILVVSEFGIRTGLSAFFCISVLSFLLVANKEVVMLFICFLGWYPVLKCRLDRIRPKWLGYVCRFLIFAAAVTVFYFSVTRLFGIVFDLNEGLIKVGLPVMGVMLVAAFFVFDVAVSRLYVFYEVVLKEKLHHILFS